MKKLIALLSVFGVMSAFACDDMELERRAIKTDIYYQYAPFGKAKVVEDHVMYSSLDKAHKLTINFEDRPYKIITKFDIHPSSIDGEKVIDLTYKFKNTDDGRYYKNSKVVKLKNGKKKVAIYDWIHGRRMIFMFKDFSEEEWSEMRCPNLPSEEEKFI